MKYDLYKKNGVVVNESYFETSDGISLKLYEFIPKKELPEKPVFVFVAGWVSEISGWHSVLEKITANIRTIYIETREKKSSILPKEKVNFSIERLGKDISEIIEEKIPESSPFYFSGSSLGSTVILDYLSKNYKKPVKSFLISPIATFDFPFWAVIIIRFFPYILYGIVKHVIIFYLINFRVDKKKEPEQAAKYLETVGSAEPKRLQANAISLMGYEIWPCLEKIDSSVVILGAKADKLHSVETLEKMIALIPDSKIYMMESNKETHSGVAGEYILKQIESDL